jgi:hypothetical protein
MVKAQFYELIDKKLSGTASREELEELKDLLVRLLPEKRMDKEEIAQAYQRMILRMKKQGILF